MSDIITRAQKSLAFTKDHSLAQWQRIWPAFKALSGLIISDLPEAPRAAIEAELVAINEINANYHIESEDDYKQLTDKEAEEVLSRIAAVNQLCIDSEAERVIHELVTVDRKLPVAAIEEVRQHRDIFVPRLMRDLEQAVTRVRNGEEVGESASFFALFLLTELQADETFPTILDALRLPGDGPDQLFGDAVHEIVPGLLAQFSHGSVDVIDQLIRDSNCNMYLRWSAANAYINLVRDDLISWQAAVDALHSHFQHFMDNKEYFLLAPLTIILGELAAEPALQTIRQAYERQLVEEGIVDLGTIESEMAGGEKTLKKTLEHLRPSGVTDTIAELRSWAAFKEQPVPPPNSVKATPKSFPLPKPQSHDFDHRTETAATVRIDGKIGRNAPCPCGSGKKYKRCCGQL